jgi:hypothetical protein
LFPRARVIYCSRDPRDISLSCYFQLFADGAQSFSYDLADCGTRCREVQRLARHWLRLLPFHMIEINYEVLVDDLEAESRRLIEFLELDWEPACLDFHRTERTVVTVSHWQVRQPLYKSSVGRWRNYEKHLGPLLAVLNDSTDMPTADGAHAELFEEKPTHASHLLSIKTFAAPSPPIAPVSSTRSRPCAAAFSSNTRTTSAAYSFLRPPPPDANPAGASS